MKGKEKCKALKEIRRQIAEKNDIPYAVSQCTHQGDCKGTCPKCEAELKYLERELAVRQNLGKAVAVMGISIGACQILTACALVDAALDFLDRGSYEELTGDIQIVDPGELDGAIAAPDPQETETVSELEGDIALPDFEGMEEVSPDGDEVFGEVIDEDE